MQTATTPATTTVAPSPAARLVLSLIRRNIMEHLNSQVFTPAERLRTNDNIYQCEDEAQLMRWHRNVYRVASEREAAAGLLLSGHPVSLSVAA